MNAASIAYGEARRREGRLLADAVVRALPKSGTATAHAREWRLRARSMRRVLRAFSGPAAPLRVLEVGCGNGWFAARLAEAGHQVTAIDTYDAEIEQARRVFGHLPVTWMPADPFALTAAEGPFDRILLAASVQYFPEPGVLLGHLRTLLTTTGEVHITDTVFYPDEAAAKAAGERSRNYYAALGVAGMAAHYHHHTLDSLQALGAEVLHGPGLHLEGQWPFIPLRDPFHHLVLGVASSHR